VSSAVIVNSMSGKEEIGVVEEGEGASGTQDENRTDPISNAGTIIGMELPEKYVAQEILSFSWGSGENQLGLETKVVTLGPADIEVDDEGSIWISDRRNSRILKYSSHGTLLRNLTGYHEIDADSVGDMCFDKKGNLYILGSGDVVLKFNTNGEFIDKIYYGHEYVEDRKEGVIFSINKVMVDKNDNLYIGNRGNRAYLITKEIIKESNRNKLNKKLIGIGHPAKFTDNCYFVSRGKIKIFDRKSRKPIGTINITPKSNQDKTGTPYFIGGDSWSNFYFLVRPLYTGDTTVRKYDQEGTLLAAVSYTHLRAHET